MSVLNPISRAKENAESVGEDAKALCFIID